MATQKTPTFTKQERELIDNFTKDGVRGKEYGRIQVKEYLGSNPNLLALNGTAKFIGTTQLIQEGGRSIWYMDAIDGERYRIPEPSNGIDTVLEIEFKRKDV